jgi:hypothetical protein
MKYLAYILNYLFVIRGIGVLSKIPSHTTLLAPGP